MRTRSRELRTAWVALILLVAAFVAMVAVLTPWHPLPGADVQAAPVHTYFTAHQIDRSDRYFSLARWPSYLNVVLGLVVAFAVGFTRVGRRMVASVRRRTHRWWLQVLALAALVLVLQRLVLLPGAIWGQALARDYGLSTQSWAQWGIDLVKSLAIGFAVTSLVLLLLIGLARRFTRAWFVPAATGAACLVVGLSFAYPIVVEPVFSNFTPLPDGRLRSDLVALAARDGIGVSDVLVADASSRTTAENAYVSGFGTTRRVVVYDTLLHGATDKEIEVVVAHELGHAKYNDVFVGTLEGAVVAAMGVVALFVVLRPALLRRRVGAGSMADPAIVPVLLALVALATFAAQPFENTISRQIEARADAHALELTHDPATFIAIQQRLAISSLSHLTPNPILTFWFATHPPTLQRITMALAWEAQHPNRR